MDVKCDIRLNGTEKEVSQCYTFPPATALGSALKEHGLCLPKRIRGTTQHCCSRETGHQSRQIWAGSPSPLLLCRSQLSWDSVSSSVKWQNIGIPASPRVVVRSEVMHRRSWHTAWHKKCPLNDVSLLLLTFAQCSPCVGHCANYFTEMNSLNPFKWYYAGKELHIVPGTWKLLRMVLTEMQCLAQLHLPRAAPSSRLLSCRPNAVT